MLSTTRRGDVIKRSKQRSDELDSEPEYAVGGAISVQESELDEDGELFDKENAAGMVTRSRSTRTTKPRRWTDEVAEQADEEETDEPGNDSGRKPGKRKPGMNRVGSHFLEK